MKKNMYNIERLLSIEGVLCVNDGVMTLLCRCHLEGYNDNVNCVALLNVECAGDNVAYKMGFNGVRLVDVHLDQDELKTVGKFLEKVMT